MFRMVLWRILVMIPTLLGISIVAFLVISLPPGSYLDTYTAELASAGGIADMARVEAIKQRYGLDQPIYIQYWKWISNAVRGDFGTSFRYNQPVWDLVKERAGYSALISVSVLLFQWLLALPIGMYSAVRQYSIPDYLLTVLGFVGLAIPNFLLALVLMFIGISLFQSEVGGLFSLRFLSEPWSWPKFRDFLGHLWVPIVVVGTAGLASLIRIMRGQTLDELTKPYVRTARSKGIKEVTVIRKHVGRNALNPLLSTSGWMLPEIVSAETIAGIVLGLPTLGPLLFEALRSQDMYLAGTVIMLLSAMVVIGTLVSDILLMVADPRIGYS